MADEEEETEMYLVLALLFTMLFVMTLLSMDMSYSTMEEASLWLVGFGLLLAIGIVSVKWYLFIKRRRLFKSMAMNILMAKLFPEKVRKENEKENVSQRIHSYEMRRLNSVQEVLRLLQTEKQCVKLWRSFAQAHEGFEVIEDKTGLHGIRGYLDHVQFQILRTKRGAVTYLYLFQNPLNLHLVIGRNYTGEIPDDGVYLDPKVYFQEDRSVLIAVKSKADFEHYLKSEIRITLQWILDHYETVAVTDFMLKIEDDKSLNNAPSMDILRQGCLVASIVGKNEPDVLPDISPDSRIGERPEPAKGTSVFK